MSLINKMLQDLEARRASAPAAVLPIFQDLYAAQVPAPRPARWSLILALLGVGAAAVAWWVWQSPPAEVQPDLRATQYNPPPLVEPSAASIPQEATVPSITERIIVDEALSEEKEIPLEVVTKKARVVASLAEPVETPPLPVLQSAQSEERAPAEPVVMLKTERIITTTERAQETYQEGLQRYAEQDYAQAERLWRRALDFDAQQRAARAQLVALLLAGGRRAEAQALLEQGIAALPTSPDFALMLARIYVDRNQELEALTVLEQAAARTGGDLDIAAFLATLHQRAGRHAEAVQRYQQVLAQRPLEGRWWVGLAISLEAQQDWGSARAAYERARDGNRLSVELARYAEQRVTVLRNRP